MPRAVAGEAPAQSARSRRDADLLRRAAQAAQDARPVDQGRRRSLDQGSARTRCGRDRTRAAPAEGCHFAARGFAAPVAKVAGNDVVAIARAETLVVWRMSFSENRFPLFRDMRWSNLTRAA